MQGVIKLAIFLNVFAPSDALRRAIRERFDGTNATLLFLGPAGLVSLNNGTTCTTNPHSVSGFTGIARLRPFRAAVPAVTVVEDGAFPEIEKLAGTSFGNPIPFAPVFYWDDGVSAPHGAEPDPPVTVLGRYSHGSRLPSWVSSTAPGGYRVMVSGSPAMPAALLRAVAAGAGVHLYVDGAEDAVGAAGNGLMVHAGPHEGTRRVTLPKPLAVQDERGSVLCSVAEPCTQFSTGAMRRAETRLYFVQ